MNRWLIRLVIAACVFCVTAHAAQFGDFTYTDSGSDVTITGYTGSGGAVVIPGAIDGKPVVSIGEYAFRYIDTITSITIPTGVTSIEDSAFDGCIGLTGVLTIPNGVTSIGWGAFSGCSGLTGTLTIPDGVTYIGDLAFQGCSSITHAVIPEGITMIKSSLFSACRSLTSVHIPSSVTVIGWNAFQGCWKLVDVNIPDGMKTIVDDAFLDCRSLTSIRIPASVEKIWIPAFRYCDSLVRIEVDPSNPTYSSHDGVLFLDSVSFHEGEMTYRAPYILVACPGGKSGLYSIPDTVVSVYPLAFGGCHRLTTVTIPSGVTDIGSYAFEDCSGLTGAYFHGNAPTMGNDAFSLVPNTFTIRYKPSSTGFTSPTWNGYPCEVYSNDAPVIQTIGNKSIASGSTLKFTVGADDAEGNTLQFSVTGAP